MNNKKLNIIFIIILFSLESCQELRSWFDIRPRLVNPVSCVGVILDKINYKYDADFPNKKLLSDESYPICPVTEYFIDGGKRVERRF